MDDLFGRTGVSVSHDPGGKVRPPLQPGVRGNAEFSPCGRYRYWLIRLWGEETRAGAPGFALWIGMNPSTAEADVDDPTIRKEMHFTRQMGLSGYVKCNVMDWRATNPKDLPQTGASSDRNLPTIAKMAKQARIIIVAWGSIPKSLRLYAEDVLATIGPHRLMCMGLTKDGSPRHPLYLRNDAVPIVYREPT